MIKVGVTGSNGFIGWHLCRTIELYPNKFELIEFKRDWFNQSSNLDSFVSKCDIIVHLAAINRHIEETSIYNTNVGLAERLVESFRRVDFKGQVIFSSSVQEDRDNAFGNSKKAARELFSNWSKKSNAKFHGVIIPNVFGAFGLPFYNSVISTFCYQLVNNEFPKIENDTTLNLIYINDLVKNIIELFNTDSKHNFIIEHTNTFKVSEILSVLNKFKNKYLENDIIPTFNNNFEINLFNTFRSYINLNTHFPEAVEQFVNALAIKSRVAFGIELRPIEVDSVVDATLFDTNTNWLNTKEQNVSKSINTPFFGKNFTGKVHGILRNDSYILAD